ncbi:putative WRKY transcription factor 27 [Hibiscus syriacus]|uniref:WRKY transcription factor 27 n=1 Tax=Hibiscus syriacus TaxID=106335 RepID=A0A6A2YAT1_HIBSY|nr:probable WRKY transcription factor 27 [Hibiscus syriacus]KAE8671599.1 putative WRKY transcription factor 27 [Hibiscus syriacus]
MTNLYMENWDLQEVVGEISMENPAFSFDSWSFQEEENLTSFPENFNLDELEELYNPFRPELNPYSIPVLEDHAEGKQQPLANKDSAKSKRVSRKNQKNRVVHHVTADGLQSDAWAWRKYGQKPIKGSPYPRSYYRCSSSKGCLARKQVERSSIEPGVFIITYTAEHSHGHPTRRKSTAGRTRNKSSTVTKSLADKNELHDEKEETVLVSSTRIRNESGKQKISVKMEELQQMVEEDDERDKSLRRNIMLNEGLVEGFEFEGLFLDQFPDLSHEVWCMNESTTSTGGC